MPGPSAATRYPGRWRIAFLLGIGVLVNFFDRVNLSVAHVPLIREFGISEVSFGYLSAAYAWTYALCQLPIGVLLDRFGVRRIGRGSILLWSVASFGAALTPTLGGFFAARLLLGIGEAPTFPGNAKAIGQWFAPEERSMATSLSDAAAKFASALGVPVLGLLLLRAGWRWSFAFTGLLSLLYFALFVRVYRDPPRHTAPSTNVSHQVLEEAPYPSLPFAVLLRKRKVLGLSLGMGAYNYVFFLLLTWLPSYLTFSLHMDLRQSFFYTSVPWLFATAADLLAAFTTDALIRRGWDSSKVRQAVLLGGMACGVGILGAVHARTPASALFWISLSASGLAATAPIGWTVPSLIAPDGSVGAVGGIMNFASQISGIAAPIVTGYLVASTGSFAWAFSVGGIYLVVGVLAFRFLLGRIEPIHVA